MAKKSTKQRAARRAVKSIRAVPPVEKEKPSNRQLIRAMIDAEGDEAARKLGNKLKMAGPTVEAYIKGWARIKGTSVGRVKTGKEAPGTSGAILPWYRFETHAKARAWADHRAETSGLKPGAFKIVEEAIPPQTPPDDPIRLRKWEPRKPKFAVEADKEHIRKAGDQVYTPAARRALGLDKEEVKPAKKKSKASDISNISMSEMFGDDLRKPAKKPVKKKGARA
jgi:hypothetical protein